MAFSSSKVVENVAGRLKQQIWSFDSAGVTTGVIKSGLSVVQHVNLNNAVTEGDGKAVFSGGDVTLSGLTSNDTGTVEVWGY